MQVLIHLVNYTQIKAFSYINEILVTFIQQSLIEIALRAQEILAIQKDPYKKKREGWSLPWITPKDSTGRQRSH